MQMGNFPSSNWRPNSEQNGSMGFPLLLELCEGFSSAFFRCWEAVDREGEPAPEAVNLAALFLLTDVTGVLDKEKNLLTDLSPAKIAALQGDGTISGGMIPKLETCVHAVEGGVDAAVVLDGRVPHAMLIEIFTRKGAGTLIRAD